MTTFCPVLPPRRSPLEASPQSPNHGWRRELVYFLLPDRFSDGRETSDRRPALPFSRSTVAHDAPPDGRYDWRWDLWAISGRSRFQGGTLPGARSKLRYLADLGVTALWIGPVWKQRVTGLDVNLTGDGTDDTWNGREGGLRPGQTPLTAADLLFSCDDYHGYAVQDFDSVDPRFGTEQDLADLVTDAHRHGIRVILDVLLNHSGVNFDYDTPPRGRLRPPYLFPEQYRFGSWLDVANQPVSGRKLEPDDGVWPKALQNGEWYGRHGEGNYGIGDFKSDSAEFRTSDWHNRDFAYQDTLPEQDPILDELIRIWTGWIDRSDCDGFRIDTYKHVPSATSDYFTRQVRAHAAGRGKVDFLVVGEVGGSDADAASFLQTEGLRVLSLSKRRAQTRRLAGGRADLAAPAAVLLPTAASVDDQASTRDVVGRVMTTIDDHDALGTDQVQRIAAEQTPASVVPAASLLLYGPGVPCLYYGTEQALCGPVETAGLLGAHAWAGDPAPPGRPDPRQCGADRYLREAMFGPSHPRRAGRRGRPAGGRAGRHLDADLPGFGPMGTTGQHAFTPDSPWYQAISALAQVRRRFPVLADGAIALLSTGRIDGSPLDAQLPPRYVAWSRSDRDTGYVVIATNVANPGDRGYPVLADLVLALPPEAPTGTYQMVVRADGGPAASFAAEAPSSVSTGRRPQSRVAYLPVGALAPGEVRVFVAPGAVEID